MKNRGEFVELWMGVGNRQACRIHCEDEKALKIATLAVKATDPSFAMFSTEAVYSKKLKHGSPDKFYLYVAKDHETLEKVLMCEVSHNHTELGRLFGYPECCIQSYIDNPRAPLDSDVEEWKEYWKPAANAPDVYSGDHLPSVMSPKLNVLPFFPCSLKCGEATEKAYRYYTAMHGFHPASKTEAEIDGKTFYFDIGDDKWAR